jgi:adenosine kinase
LNEALDAFAKEGVVAVITRGDKGSIVVEGEKTTEAPAFSIQRLVDTTGAGDMFAAGFLAGLARGADPYVSARLGALAAAEIIQHVGARPAVNLADLAKEKGLF